MVSKKSRMYFLFSKLVKKKMQNHWYHALKHGMKSRIIHRIEVSKVSM